MKNLVPAVAAALAGATAMYFLDPEQGRRRRALVRDKAVSYSVHTSETAQAQGRRVGDHLKGWTARLRARLPLRHRETDPATLERRVRSQLGRAVSHPKSIHVEATADRTVRLSGHVLHDELEPLLQQVERVPGVAHVDSRLEVHESAGNIPELQGESRRSARRSGRFWGLLALAAPVAILAATAARPPARRILPLGTAWPRRQHPVSRMMARAHKLRRHHGLLHV